jgi:hypothetical protein
MQQSPYEKLPEKLEAALLKLEAVQRNNPSIDLRGVFNDIVEYSEPYHGIRTCIYCAESCLFSETKKTQTGYLCTHCGCLEEYAIGQHEYNGSDYE